MCWYDGLGWIGWGKVTHVHLCVMTVIQCRCRQCDVDRCMRGVVAWLASRGSYTSLTSPDLAITTTLRHYHRCVHRARDLLSTGSDRKLDSNQSYYFRFGTIHGLSANIDPKLSLRDMSNRFLSRFHFHSLSASSAANYKSIQMLQIIVISTAKLRFYLYNRMNRCKLRSTSRIESFSSLLHRPSLVFSKRHAAASQPTSQDRRPGHNANCIHA